MTGNLSIFLVVALTACALINNCEENISYWKLSREIINAHAQFMKETENLHLFAFGGEMPSDVKKFNVEYSTKQQPSIAQTRRLLVKATESLIQLVNNNKKIRPYLQDYPFTSHNTEVGIGFLNSDGSYPRNEKIAYAFIHNNNVDYNVFNEGTGDLETIFQEKYEDALRIVRDEGQDGK